MFKAVNNIRNKKGFTLIEVLFVIIVIAILAAIAIMRINTTRADAERNSCEAQQSIINTQLEQNQLDGNGYPADQAAFNTFLADAVYFPDGAPVCQGPAPTCVYSGVTFRADCTTN